MYDDNKTKLDAIYVKPEAIVLGEQLESDRYFILIEEKKTDKPTISEPVQRVSCSVRVPIRTGLKRKKSVRKKKKLATDKFSKQFIFMPVLLLNAQRGRSPYFQLF